jgi:hypothetical protein
MKFNPKRANVPSSYELINVKWVGIEYDKEKLVDFLKTYESLNPNNDIEELETMNEILKSHSTINLQKLLDNDKEYSRWATIEKLSRIASVEILLNQQYSKDTFIKFSNLPISDYKLVVRRTKELVNSITDITAEAEADTSKVPGVK